MKKHYAATGFVVDEERTHMLMVYHRKLDKWAAPGGHVEENESPDEAALREIFEETGVKVKIIYTECELEGEKQLSTPIMVLEEHIPEGKDEAHIHIDFIYLCKADKGELKAQEAEVKDVKWMTKAEVLTSNTFPSIKLFAAKTLTS